MKRSRGLNLTNKRKKNKHKRFNEDGGGIVAVSDKVFLTPSLDRVKSFIESIDESRGETPDDRPIEQDILDGEGGESSDYVTAPEDEANVPMSEEPDDFFDKRPPSALDTVSWKCLHTYVYST